MATDCYFCSFSGGNESKIWESDTFYSFFDNFPVSPGHALIIPKRHIIDIASLNDGEWLDLQRAIKAVISLIEKTNLRSVYTRKKNLPTPENSSWFIEKALDHPRINTKPDSYNHGVNDGTAAGRTIDHLHWHIIPRYIGDMEDPRGGVRYVIPEMGNYKIAR